MPESGYVNYYEVLGVGEGATLGEIRKTYKRNMKRLVQDIARQEITEDRRASFLLDMARLNAALYILRDKKRCPAYVQLRTELIALEQVWCGEAGQDPAQDDQRRREFESKIRDFLSLYVEEAMLEAGRDAECVEASHWDMAHERHSFRILRHYRHTLYREILERLPFSEVTPPQIDWQERRELVAALASTDGNARRG